MADALSVPFPYSAWETHTAGGLGLMPSYFDTPPGYRPRDRRFVMQDDPRFADPEAARVARDGARDDQRARADAARDTAKTQADIARDAARAGRGVVKAARRPDEVDAPDAPDAADAPELKDQIGAATDKIKKAAAPAPIPASAGGNRRNETLEGMSPEQKKRIWHPELFNPDGSDKVGAVPILAGGARGTIPPYTGPGSEAVDVARTAGDEGRAIGEAARTDAMATADSARALGESARTDAMATADAARQAAGAPAATQTTGQWPEGTPPGQWQSTQSQAQSTRNVNTQNLDEMDEEERRRFLANQ